MARSTHPNRLWLLVDGAMLSAVDPAVFDDAMRNELIGNQITGIDREDCAVFPPAAAVGPGIGFVTVS